ncbi:MAG: hypothetical protein QM652_10350 [Legionella sp.]|uniref:hypothetical protein n=1 Tax=Legionella sp. TaxID=459 RepID=UPI0039E37E1B
MTRNSIKLLSGLSIVFFSLTASATNTITVTVKTTEKSVAALGYAVEGKRLGGAGKSYTGKGPANHTYLFGYRKRLAYGDDFSCGSQVLTKDSTVTLVTDGEHCSIIVD